MTSLTPLCNKIHKSPPNIFRLGKLVIQIQPKENDLDESRKDVRIDNDAPFLTTIIS